MKTKDIKKKLRAIRLSVIRETRKSQGFFDGRFKQKTIKDKKKEESKNKCDKKVFV